MLPLLTALLLATWVAHPWAAVAQAEYVNQPLTATADTRSHARAHGRAYPGAAAGSGARRGAERRTDPGPGVLLRLAMRTGAAGDVG